MKWALGILLLCSVALGTFNQQCALTFQAAYNDSEIYTAKKCCLNVHRLAKKLQADGVDLNEVKIVFILYEMRKFRPVPGSIRARDVLPAVSRQRDSYWYYHAIVEHKGKILDLDHSPEPVDAREYFGKVFPDLLNETPEYQVTNRLNTLFVRAIPAADYVKENVTPENWETLATKYRSETSPDLPPVRTANDLLNEIAPRQ